MTNATTFISEVVHDSKLNVLAPVQKTLKFLGIEDGIVRVEPCDKHGTIGDYARIILGAFEEESNFFAIIKSMDSREIEHFDIIALYLKSVNSILYIKKGVTVKEISLKLPLYYDGEQLLEIWCV